MKKSTSKVGKELSKRSAMAVHRPSAPLDAPIPYVPTEADRQRAERLAAEDAGRHEAPRDLRPMLAKLLHADGYTLPGERPQFARAVLDDVRIVIDLLEESDAGGKPLRNTLWFLARIAAIGCELDDDARSQARRAAKVAS